MNFVLKRNELKDIDLENRMKGRFIVLEAILFHLFFLYERFVFKQKGNNNQRGFETRKTRKREDLTQSQFNCKLAGDESVTLSTSSVSFLVIRLKWVIQLKVSHKMSYPLASTLQ
ncbi:hypothetical protein Avbf_17695 [Armadillidium vulgare]|nr:hypothetical protein Avbf_17695 [Armadillidium vulgare]